MIDRFPNLRARDVIAMSWHEFWFYFDWLLDEKAEQEAESSDPFDLKKPWRGRALTPDIAASLGFQVREIQ